MWPAGKEVAMRYENLPDNEQFRRWLEECVELCRPDRVRVLNGSADSENFDPGKPFTLSTARSLIWVNNSNQVLTWQNNSLQTLLWATTGFIYQRSPISSSGIFLGLTLTGTFAGGTSTTSGLVINALLIEYQDKTRNTGDMHA